MHTEINQSRVLISAMASLNQIVAYTERYLELRQDDICALTLLFIQTYELPNDLQTGSYRLVNCTLN